MRQRSRRRTYIQAPLHTYIIWSWPLPMRAPAQQVMEKACLNAVLPYIPSPGQNSNRPHEESWSKMYHFTKFTIKWFCQTESNKIGQRLKCAVLLADPASVAVTVTFWHLGDGLHNLSGARASVALVVLLDLGPSCLQKVFTDHKAPFGVSSPQAPFDARASSWTVSHMLVVLRSALLNWRGLTGSFSTSRKKSFVLRP